MAKRRKKKTSKKVDVQYVTFKTFFNQCVMLKRLNSWQYDEIRAFFSQHKLKDKEDVKIFEEVLKKY